MHGHRNVKECESFKMESLVAVVQAFARVPKRYAVRVPCLVNLDSGLK
jgi:hypothetical protein